MRECSLDYPGFTRNWLVEPRKRRNYDTLRQILEFVTAEPRPTPLPADCPVFQTQVATLEGIIDRARDSAELLMSDEPERWMQIRLQRRDVLRTQYLKPLCDLASVRCVGGRKLFLQVPRAWKNEHDLLATARTILREYTPYLSALVSYGFPETILRDLEQAIFGLESASKRYGYLCARRRLARARFCQALREASSIKTGLNTLIARACKNDPVHGSDLFQSWRQIAYASRLSAIDTKR